MSSPTGKRDIVRLRTFADDVETARQEKGVSAEEVAKVLPTTEPTSNKGVFHTVEKKALTLKETPMDSSLDSDGVKFAEDVAVQVADQAYEEYKATQTTGAASDTVDIHETDTLEAITDTPSAAAPTPEPIIPKPPKPISIAPVTPPAPKPDPASFAIKPAIHTTSKSITTPPLAAQDDLHEGEIVTDKKRERFKLIPAIGEAMSDWFDDTKEQIEEAQKEKYTVGKIQDRVETIKAAAQQKTIAPDEDFMEVAKRIKETKKDVAATATSPVVVKPKPAIDARWTHTINDEVKTQTETVHTTPTSYIPPAPKPTPTPTVVPAPAAVAVPMALVQNTAPTVASKPPAPAPAPVATPAPAAPTPQTFSQPTAPAAQPESSFTPAPAVTPPAQDPSGGQRFALPTAKLPNFAAGREFLPSPIMALLVVGIAVIAGVGTSLYFFWQPEPEQVIATPTATPLFTAQLQTSVPLSSHSETMETLLAAINSRPDTLFMYFTEPETNALVPPNQTMSFLAPLVPGSFARSVTNVSIGAQDNRPFIVLRVNNFDNAFSGMLSWEQTMSADLAPMFGPVVTESFDPQARTDTRTRAAFFRDVIANNLSGRLLADGVGDDRIIYVFVDKQTIVIASDRLQLANIIPLLR